MRLQKSVQKLSTLINIIAAGAIVAMMILTCADVVLRFFRRPIPGTYEIVGFIGIIAVSFALGATTVEHSHIAVEFLTQRFRPKFQWFISGVNNLIAFSFFAVLAWRSALYAVNLKTAGEVSMTVQIPLYPFALSITVGCIVLCCVLLLHAAENLRRSLSQ